MALGDPTRRQIFERIAARPQAVGEIARGLPVTRPAVSQHLKVLMQAGLANCDAAGTRRVYRVNPRGVEQMRDYLDRFWDSALMSFKAVAEAAEKEAGK